MFLWDLISFYIRLGFHVFVGLSFQFSYLEWCSNSKKHFLLHFIFFKTYIFGESFLLWREKGTSIGNWSIWSDIRKFHCFAQYKENAYKMMNSIFKTNTAETTTKLFLTLQLWFFNTVISSKKYSIYNVLDKIQR